MTNQNKELCTCEVPFEETTNFCHRCMKHIRKGQELSVCCSTEKRSSVSDEGTGYYQCAKCGNEFIDNQLSTYEESIVNPHPDELEAVKGKELETWEEQLNKIWSRGHVPEWANDVKTVTTSLIREVESQALERGKEAGSKGDYGRKMYQAGVREGIEQGLKEAKFTKKKWQR